MKAYLLVGPLLLAVGCAGAPRCVRSAECGAAAICRSDGTCGPLAIDAVTQSARATWLEPARVSLRGATDDGDSVELGPSSTMYLAFEGVPVDRAPLSAELVLTPVGSRADVPRPVQLVVDVVRPFSAAGEPDVVAPRVAFRDVAAGPARVVRIDVSEVARAARANQLRALDVAVRVSGGPLRIASVRASDARTRPRLEILAP